MKKEDDMIDYLKDCILAFLLLLGLFLIIVLMISFIMWDTSIFEGNRFWNEGTKSFLRVIFFVSILISTLVKIKISFKPNNNIF